MIYKRLKEVNLKEKIGTRVYLKFIARDISVRLQKDKKSRYLCFNMWDRNICVEVKMFGVTDETVSKIKEATCYNAAVDVNAYEKAAEGYSCLIYNIEANNDNPDSYLNWHPNTQKCAAAIVDIINGISCDFYRMIASGLVKDNWDKFASWGAAKSMHHFELGGLLVHSVEVAEICGAIADAVGQFSRNEINKDLLMCAAVLHDIGKIEELSIDPVSGYAEYNKKNALTTHIVLGYAIVDKAGKELIEKLDKAEAEDNLERLKLLQHCILSHHGKLEWGSPINPRIIEAAILHSADSLDAQMYKMDAALDQIEVGETFSKWSNTGLDVTYKSGV